MLRVGLRLLSAGKSLTSRALGSRDERIGHPSTKAIAPAGPGRSRPPRGNFRAPQVRSPVKVRVGFWRLGAEIGKRSYFENFVENESGFDCQRTVARERRRHGHTTSDHAASRQHALFPSIFIAGKRPSRASTSPQTTKAAEARDLAAFGNKSPENAAYALPSSGCPWANAGPASDRSSSELNGIEK